MAGCLYCCGQTWYFRSMVTESYMVEAIHAHRRQRVILRVLFGACCVGVLGYLLDGSGNVVTIPGRVVSAESSKDRSVARRIGSTVVRFPGSVRIETERETFSWTDAPSQDVWVDARVGRFSGVLHVQQVRAREHR